MAKAGSGDVLAGVITGLAAQEKDTFRSAALECGSTPAAETRRGMRKELTAYWRET